jgi:hypothetical protein
MKSGSLKLLEPSEPIQAYVEIAFDLNIHDQQWVIVSVT